MNKFKGLFGSQYITPQKNSRLFQSSYNQSRGFSSSKRHRNPIFYPNRTNSATRKSNKIDQISFVQTQNHIQFQRVISDDFCGCQNTLSPCKRIYDAYLKQVSLNELKFQYAKVSNIQSAITNQRKKQLINLLPYQYPQLFITHINNLLSNYQSSQLTNQSFTCLAWIQFHCKLEYITFFFFNDLRKILHNKDNLFYQLQVYFMRQKCLIKQQVQYYQKMQLPVKEFIMQIYQTIGASIIPLSQYGKFLQMIKQKGLRGLYKLIWLFIVKKKTEMYQILKLWHKNSMINLRMYLRYLNWELFFQQLNTQ